MVASSRFEHPAYSIMAYDFVADIEALEVLNEYVKKADEELEEQRKAKAFLDKMYKETKKASREVKRVFNIAYAAKEMAKEEPEIYYSRIATTGHSFAMGEVSYATDRIVEAKSAMQFAQSNLPYMTRIQQYVYVQQLGVSVEAAIARAHDALDHSQRGAQTSITHYRKRMLLEELHAKYGIAPLKPVWKFNFWMCV